MRSKFKITGAVILWVLFFVVIITVRFFPEAGEWYARRIYPVVAYVLSLFSSIFPFSLGDCFIVMACMGLLFYWVRGFRKRISFWRRLRRSIFFLGWIYIWFYVAWGLNYFREDFYTRHQLPHAVYEPDKFRVFLDDYVHRLNADYTTETIASARVAQDILKGYEQMADTLGLIRPRGGLKVKKMLFSSFLSKVGVTGYMGPFFTEFQLNEEIRPEEYPGVYAHEMAHRLNVSSEAEANFCAWLVCNRSTEPAIRYSGNFLIFGYVMRNAAVLLEEEEYLHLIQGIRPEILQQYKSYQHYWQEKYSPWIGKIQNRMYNFFLKSNRISSGTKNYSEVIGMILAWQNATLKTTETE